MRGLSLLLMFGACSVTDPTLLEALRREDSGVQLDALEAQDGASADVANQDVTQDAGLPQVAVNTCGAPDTLIIDSTRRNLRIDTRGLTPNVDVSASCNTASAGSDGFIGLEVVAGQTWHFHLTSTRLDGNPSLYLLRDTCNARACEQVADQCRGQGEEHFAFVPDTSGRWYLGIDDGAMGGAVYDLSVYLTICGDGVNDHGEGCDGDTASNECSDECRTILDAEHPSEVFPNETLAEANEVRLDGEPLIVSGSIGDRTGRCAYPNIFSLEVPDDSRLLVESVDCTGPETSLFELALLSATGRELQRGESLEGCPVVDRFVEAGRYFITATPPVSELDESTFDFYRLRFEVIPQ